MEQGWQVSAGQEAHVQVQDFVYGQGFVIQIYTIQDGNEKIEFAAGEFSNGVWGFYNLE